MNDIINREILPTELVEQESTDVLTNYQQDSAESQFGDTSEAIAFLNQDTGLDDDVNESYQNTPKEDYPALLDVPTQIAYGFAEAVNSTSKLISEPILRAVEGEDFDKEKFNRASETGLPEPKTTAGAIAKPIAQATAGILGAGKFFKAAGIAKSVEATKLGAKLMPFISGFAGEFIAFDEHEKNLTETLNETGLKDNAVVKLMNDYLGKDDDDNAIEGRLKNALEGSFVGAGADALLKGLKYVKFGRLAKNITTNSKKVSTAAVQNIRKVSSLDSLKKARDSKKVGKISDNLIARSNVGKEGKTIEQSMSEAQEHFKTQYIKDLSEVEPDSKEIISLMNKAKNTDIDKQLNAIAIKEAEVIDSVQVSAKEAFETYTVTGDASTLDDALEGLFESMVFRNSSIEASRPIAQALNFRGKTPQIIEMNKIRNMVNNGDVSSKMKLVEALSKINNASDLDSLSGSLNGAVKKGKARLTYDLAIYTFQNSLLSSAKTFASDTLSTGLFQAVNLAETSAGEAIGMMRRGIFGGSGMKSAGDVAQFAETKEMLDVYLASAKDSVISLSKDTGAIIKGTDKERLFDNTRNHFSKMSKDVGDRFGSDTVDDFLNPDAWGVSNESAWYKTINFLKNNQNKTPLHWMAKKDDYISGVRFSAEKNRMAARLARQEGLTGDALSARTNQLKKSVGQVDDFKTQEEFVDWVNQTGEISKSDAISVWGANKNAFEETRVATFRDELGETGKKIQDLINTVPGGKLVVPFFKTPTKLLWERYFMERGPGVGLSLINKNTRMGKMWRNGGAERDLVMGQLALSGTAHTIGWQMATAGKVQGELPTNKSERDLLMSYGVRENSVKVGDEWIDISRYSPMADILLAPANMMAVMNRNEDKFGVEEEESVSEFMFTSVSGMASVLSSKTFTQNLGQFLDVISSENPDRAKKYFSQLAASFIPAALGDVDSIETSIKEGMDEDYTKYKQQSDGLWESIKRRAGADTRPVLDILGEPMKAEDNWQGIAPARTSEQKDDPLLREMLNVGAYVSKPAYKIEGVKLEPKERYRWIEIMGELNSRGSLEELIFSDFYVGLPDVEKTGIKGFQNMTKSGMIEKQYNDIKKQAKLMLLQENNELEERISNYKNNVSSLSAQRPATRTVLQGEL